MSLTGAHPFPPEIMAPCSFDLGFPPVPLNRCRSLHPLAPRPVRATGPLPPPVPARITPSGALLLATFSVFSFASLDHGSPQGAAFSPFQDVLHFLQVLSPEKVLSFLPPHNLLLEFQEADSLRCTSRRRGTLT